MQTETPISAGFSDPVFQSQVAFRALLAALSEPGLEQHMATSIAQPDGLSAAAATALLTLADYETPVFLPHPLSDGPAAAWLRFHCGATIAPMPEAAAFAVIDGAQPAPLLADFHAGVDEFPDRSATLLVQCTALEGGPAVRLTGPGIAGERIIAPLGLRTGFWAEVAANAELYPLGVDLLLCHGEHVIGLPRSIRIEEL